MQIIIEMNPKSLSSLAFHKNSETQSRGLHRPLHSLPIFSLTGSGLSQLHLVLVECAYQSYSREMRPNSLVPWWLRRLVQACDMSSTSGLTWDFKFLSSGNFHQIQNTSPHVPTLPDSFPFSVSILISFLNSLLA